MGSGPSRPSAPTNLHTTNKPTAYQPAASDESVKSKTSGSDNPSQGSSKSQRRNAVRYSRPPPAPPGSRRDRMLRQQQKHPFVQEESVKDQSHNVHNQVFSSRDADLAQEDYVSYAMAEDSGFFASHTRPGTGTRGLSLQRTRATATPSISTSGFVPRTGFSGFARRQAESHARLNSSQMQVPSTPQAHAQEQASSTPQYLVRPRSKGYTHTSRFREAL